MTTSQLVYKVRPALIRRSVFAIARGAGVREDFEAQLEKFFDALERAVLVEERVPPLLPEAWEAWALPRWG